MADVLESVVECYNHAANIGATREQNGKTIFLEWYLYLDNHAFVSEFYGEFSQSNSLLGNAVVRCNVSYQDINMTRLE